MEQKKLVIVITRGLDDERSSVAWSIANAGIASGFEVTAFLVSSGVDWVRKGAASVAHLNPLDPSLGDLIGNFMSNGGNVLVCPPCAKVRGYEAEDLVDGVRLSSAVHNGITTGPGGDMKGRITFTTTITTIAPKKPTYVTTTPVSITGVTRNTTNALTSR